MAWRKGSRGLQLVWIDVLFVKIEELIVEVTLPRGTVDSLREEAIAIKGQAIVAVSRLKTFTGRLCWVSGVLPRMRWAVRVLYSVLAAHEREVKARGESTRSRDPRVRSRAGHTPDHVVHTKRMGLALAWMAAFWQAGSRSLVRVYYVHPPPHLTWQSSPMRPRGGSEASWWSFRAE